MNEIQKYIAANEPKIMEDLFSLIRIPSISALPEHHDDMLACAQRWAQLLLEAGVDEALVMPSKGNPIVFAQKIVDPNAKTVLVYAHYDVMPAEPLELWKSQPFEPEVRDGYIWARGADDDKGQSFIQVKAFEYLVKNELLKNNVKFIFEGEEEIGSPSLEAFCEEHKELLKADVILVSDTSMLGAELPSLTTGLRGLAYWEIEGTGPNRAQQFVEVRARVEGYLENMLFAEGTYVNKNQVLFVINQDQYRAKADKARAQLKKDEAQALKAERDLKRIRPLYEQNAASQLDLDNAEAAYESAVATVAMSEADLAQAELELGYTIVRSPLAGHISERNVDLGTLVGPGGKSLLATVVKSDTVLVDFSMTALDYLKSKERNINLGQQDSTRSWQPNITITLADNTVYPYKGYVDFAEPQVDPQTGTFSVRAEMPNPKQVLLPGQFTKVKLLLDVREGAILVPMKAVTIEKGGAYIYTMRKDDTVEKRFIELGPEVGNNVVVERGLAVGETIVVEGFHKLTPGMKVRISQPETEVKDTTMVAGDSTTGMKNNAKGE